MMIRFEKPNGNPSPATMRILPIVVDLEDRAVMEERNG
jgi:hypothetical protein